MMEAALFLMLGGAILGGAILARRERLRGWERAVAARGLQVLETSSFLGLQLRAYAGPVEVRIESAGDKGRNTRIVVLAPGPPDFQAVRICPEPLFKFGREIEVGAAYFDSELFVDGPAKLVLALLDAETRRMLLEVKSKYGLEISAGEIKTVLSRDEDVPDVLPLLLEIRERFAPQVEIPRRLTENARQDPEPGVRLQNLLLLIRELPDAPETVGALREACLDPVPEIRLRAARELGEEGRGVLFELAESLLNDEVSAEAVSALAGELPFERVNAILDRALSRRRGRTARACLEAIGRGGDAAAVEVLTQVLEREHGELAPMAAWALGATGSPAAEPPLIQVLERDDENLRIAAANALGRVGSVAAVLPLKELADRFLLGESRKAARQAIAEIQSRVQGASPGQLSLAGAEAGQLSLASDPAGRLSLGEDESGNRS
ncbi:MAG: HEAT repeat domain-containing protein [Thermoanaerobaculia bacterium]